MLFPLPRCAWLGFSSRLSQSSFPSLVKTPKCGMMDLQCERKLAAWPGTPNPPSRGVPHAPQESKLGRRCSPPFFASGLTEVEVAARH